MKQSTTHPTLRMIDNDVWLRLVLFIGAGLITTGPNMMMVLASTTNFGFKRTLPHISGVLVGTFLVFASVGLGLHALLTLYPALEVFIQIAGVCYLSYLAIKIATAKGPSDTSSGAPLSFWQGIGIQAVNIKMMGLAASVLATYAVASNPTLNIFLVAFTAVLLNGPCLSLWGVFGLGMKRFLSNAWSLRLFNLALAGLIFLTLVPIVKKLLTKF